MPVATSRRMTFGTIWSRTKALSGACSASQASSGLGRAAGFIPAARQDLLVGEPDELRDDRVLRVLLVGHQRANKRRHVVLVGEPDRGRGEFAADDRVISVFANSVNPLTSESSLPAIPRTVDQPRTVRADASPWNRLRRVTRPGFPEVLVLAATSTAEKRLDAV